MAAIASKRKLNTKSIKDIYQALKEVEEGKSKLQVAAKYGIPKNTLSTWIKNKDKIFEAAKKGRALRISMLQMVGLTAGKSDTMYLSKRSLVKEMRAPMK